LVIQVANHILIFLSFIELVLDGTHVIEAPRKKQIKELDSSPIIFDKVFSGIKRIDDLPVDELSLEAFQMSALGELVFLFLFNIFLFSLV
jgi:hypothetical protein